MPGWKKYYRRKRRFPLKRTKKSTAFARLKKDVRMLKRKTKVAVQEAEYKDNILGSGADVVSPYIGYCLTQYSNWSHMWPSTTSALVSSKSKMTLKKMLLNSLVTLDNVNNEEGEIKFTYVVLQGKDTFTPVLDAFGAPVLTGGQHYTIQDGFAYINKNYFKILQYKTFVLTGGDGADLQADRSSIVLRTRLYPKFTVENPDGSWNTLITSPDPSDNIYVVLFNNNSAADTESPRWTGTMIATLDQ